MPPKGAYMRKRLSESNLNPSTAVEYSKRFKKPLQVLHKDEAVVSKSGNYIGVFTTLEVADVGDCMHTVTLCNKCAPIWFHEYIVMSFRHSLTGYGKGCRCDVCLGPGKVIEARRARVNAGYASS